MHRSIEGVIVRRSAPVLVAALVLVACGGGSSGKPLTEPQLVAKINAECARLQKAGADLVNAQDPSALGAKVGTYLHRAAGELRNRADAITALRAPSSVAKQVQRFTTLLGQYADRLDGLASSIKSGEGYNDLLARSTSTVNTLNKLSDQADTIAATLGFTACAT
jgi:hypothetical protein